jgi:hypothetical protein
MQAYTLIQSALCGNQARAIEDGIGQRFLGTAMGAGNGASADIGLHEMLAPDPTFTPVA